jgi:hypothetical protein
LQVIEDESLRKRLATNAQTLAREKYSYEVYVEKTRKIYDYLQSRLNEKKAIRK